MPVDGMTTVHVECCVNQWISISIRAIRVLTVCISSHCCG